VSAASVLALKLGGFLLAHALWIISDLDQGASYVPQVLCDKGPDRELFVFEADTQLEAIQKGKAFLAEKAGAYDRCAFAREGQVQGKDGYVDVLSLEIFERSSVASLTIIQPYRKSSTALTLLGNEVLVPGGREALPTSETIVTLHEGAAEHEPARAIWDKLNSKRAEPVDPF
jgi:hypothetical protein